MARNPSAESDPRKIVLFWWLGALSLLGLIVVATYNSVQHCAGPSGLNCQDPIVHFGSTGMAAVAAWACGALMGFLFGVPRYRAESDSAPSSGNGLIRGDRAPTPYSPNTNLEQISDWLTKLFVGATLVELGKVPGLLVRFGNYFSESASDAHVTVAAAIYFAILGFFVAFFYAGLYLTDTLNSPSTLMETFEQRAPLAEESTTEALAAFSGDALSTAREALAGAIPKIDPNLKFSTDDISFAIAEMKRLSQRYQEIRSSFAPGDDRTRKMEGIVSQMRLVAPAATGEIEMFKNSVIAGERLAAIILLQLAPDPEQINWLVDRFRIERPFVQYHAALALQNAGRTLSEKRTVREAVENVIEILLPGTAETTDRVRLLRKIEKELAGKI